MVTLAWVGGYKTTHVLADLQRPKCELMNEEHVLGTDKWVLDLVGLVVVMPLNFVQFHYSLIYVIFFGLENGKILCYWNVGPNGICKLQDQSIALQLHTQKAPFIHNIRVCTRLTLQDLSTFLCSIIVL